MFHTFKTRWLSVLFNSVDENVKSNEAFENLGDKKFEFELQDQHISIKGNFKQNCTYWKNTIKENDAFPKIIKVIYFCKKLPLALDCGQSKYFQ